MVVPAPNDEGPLYGIKLDVFEGPMDLLLYLIRKGEIDIYDIPIANITRQFLEYVDIIKTLNLEQAGDFVLMAATLMKIKSRMLLPSEGDEDEEGADPREELVRRLLEYQQFKELAGWLEGEQESHKDIYYRGSSFDSEGLEDTNGDPLEAYRNVGLFDLMTAFRAALLASPGDNFHEIETLDVTIEERVEEVRRQLAGSRQVSFSDLVSGVPRMVMIVTFIAILEMIKTGDAIARQTGAEGEIWLYRAERPTESDTPMIGPESTGGDRPNERD